MDDHAASGLSVPSLTVVLGASAEIPSRITARISALFAANDGAGGGASTFRSVFVWPYNNVVALGNLCAHLRQVRAGGYLTKYLVLLDMRFAPPPSEAMPPPPAGAVPAPTEPILPVVPPPPAAPWLPQAQAITQSQIFAGPYGADAPAPPAAPQAPVSPTPGGGG